MGIDRIVSFFPSATELLYALGVGDKVFGVTHECLYPEDAKSKPRIISSVFDPNTMSSKEIDDNAGFWYCILWSNFTQHQSGSLDFIFKKIFGYT